MGTKKSAHENERIEIYKNNRPKLACKVPDNMQSERLALFQARPDFSRSGRILGQVPVFGNSINYSPYYYRN